MKFFTHDAQGNIVNSGDCHPDVLSSYAINGLMARTGDGNPLTQYYDIANDQIANYSQEQIERRAKPPGIGFRWSLGVWVDERSLARAKIDKWQEIKRACDAAEFGGFDIGPYRFDSDQMSQIRINTAMQAALDARIAGDPFSIDWTLANDVTVTLTRTQVIAMGRALQSHVYAQHQRAIVLRAEIAAAISVAEVEAITW